MEISSLDSARGQTMEQFAPSQLQLIKKLGQGAYGAVYQALDKETGHIVAVKVIDIATDRSNTAAVTKEIQTLQKCHSPFITAYYATWHFNHAIWFSIEYCDAGSLYELMKKQDKPLTEEQVHAVLYQVVAGLKYLDENGIIHRDLKADNILLKSNGEAKLADFGTAAQVSRDEKKNTTVGSAYWMAPECAVGETYTSKVDIWSLGITVIEMLQMDPPYYDFLPIRALFLISDMQQPPPTFTEPAKYSAEIRDFVSKCLIKDQTQRATIQELSLHPAVQCMQYGRSKAIIADWIERSAVVIAENEEKFLRDVEQGMFGISLSSDSIERAISSPRLKSCRQDEGEQCSPRTKMYKITELVAAMRDRDAGLSIKKRSRHMKSYHMCFVGEDAVTWMVEKLGLKSREEAVAIGEVLMYRGIIHHVTDSEPFIDGKQFYRFTKDDKRAQVSATRETHKKGRRSSVSVVENKNKITDEKPSNGWVSGTLKKLGRRKSMEIVTSFSDFDENKINSLVLEMRDSVSGVAIRDRKYHFHTYETCFVGSEAVDWFMERKEELKLNSRKDAVRLGELLMSRGVFHHVINRQPFKDGYKFYRFYMDEPKYSQVSFDVHKAVGEVVESNEWTTNERQAEMYKQSEVTMRERRAKSMNLGRRNSLVDV